MKREERLKLLLQRTLEILQVELNAGNQGYALELYEDIEDELFDVTPLNN